MLAAHSLAAGANTENSTGKAVLNMDDFSGFFFTLTNADGFVKKFWNETLREQLRRDLPHTDQVKTVLLSFDALVQDPRMDSPGFGSSFANLTADSVTFLKVLLPIRQHLAKLILKDRQFAESRHIVKDFLPDTGITLANLFDEMLLEGRLRYETIERQYARYIFDVYARAAQERRVVHVYGSATEVLRLARFVKECYATAGIKRAPVYVDQKHLTLAKEVPGADHTTQKLRELAQPFKLPTEN